MPETFKAYITRYALTAGIELVEVRPAGDDSVATLDRWTQYFHKGDWHRTYDDALKRAEEMRAKKIASVEKSLKKLRALKFEEPSDG